MPKFGGGQTTIKIDITASGDAARKLTEVANAAAKAQAAVSGGGPGRVVGGNPVPRMPVAPPGVPRGVASAPGAMGAMGAAGPHAAVALAGMMAVGHVMDKLAKAGEVLQNSFLTNAQKARGLTAELIPFGDKIIKLGDAIDGVADKLARREMQGQFFMAKEDVTGRRMQEEYGLRNQVAEANARVQGTQRFRYGAFPGFDRSTAGGRIAEQEYLLMQGAGDAVVNAKRDLFTAGAARGQQQRNVDAARSRMQGFLSSRDDALGRLSGFERIESQGVRKKAEIDDAARTANERNAQAIKAQRDYEAELLKLNELKTKEIEAQSRLNQANLEKMRAQVELLRQREARMSAAQTSIGAMNQGEFLNSANALRLVQQFGIENLPPEIQAQAARLAPGFVQARQETFGGQRINQISDLLGPGFAEILKADPGLENRLAQSRQELNKVQADVRVNLNLDSEQVAKALAAVVSPMVAEVFRQMKLELEMTVRNLQTGRRIASNQNY